MSRNYILADQYYRKRGRDIRLDVWVHTRGGTRSPDLILVGYEGKWRTPFEMRVRFPYVQPNYFQQLLRDYLPDELLREEMMRTNWILDLIPKDDCWKGGYLQVPMDYE